MTWAKINPPPLSAHRAQEYPVLMSLVNQRGRRAQIRMLLRPHMLRLPWVQRGETVSVEAGHGQHEGLLRVTPKGEFELRTPSGSKMKGGSSLWLILPLPPFKQEGKAPTPVDFSAEPEELIVHLPRWTLPPVKAPHLIDAPSIRELREMLP